MDIFLIFLYAEKERHMALKHLSKQWIYFTMVICRKNNIRETVAQDLGNNISVLNIIFIALLFCFSFDG